MVKYYPLKPQKILLPAHRTQNCRKNLKNRNNPQPSVPQPFTQYSISSSNPPSRKMPHFALR